MKRLSRGQGILLFYAVDALLLLVLLLTFLPLSRRNVPPSRDSALLNVNRAGEIRRITISAPDTDGTRADVVLERAGPFWTGTDSRSGHVYRWPADQQSVADLLAVAVLPVRLFTKASGVSAWKELGVDGETAVELGFYNGAGGTVSQLFFGRRDSLTGRIAVRTWTDQAVYEVDDSVATYLTGSADFWSDPYVYPQCLTGYGRVRSEQLPRHGALLAVAPAARVLPERTLREDFENGARATLAVYRRDGGYVVIPAFAAGPAASAEERAALESLTYRYAVSEWTYGRLTGGKDGQHE